MNTIDDNILDVDLPPETNLRTEEIWIQTWSKNFGILTVISALCNISYNIFFGGRGLLEPLNIPLIVGSSLGLLLFTFAGGLILGLVLAFIPFRKLPYFSKLPLAITFGAFLINAKLIFSFL